MSVFFNWSRTPSTDKIKKVYIATPNAFTSFKKQDITKSELINSLHNYNEITDLHLKKHIMKLLFIGSFVSVLFILFIYNFLTNI